MDIEQKITGRYESTSKQSVENIAGYMAALQESNTNPEAIETQTVAYINNILPHPFIVQKSLYEPDTGTLHIEYGIVPENVIYFNVQVQGTVQNV